MLRISKTDGLIGIHRTPSKVSISQPKADFEIQKKDTKLTIHREPLQIRIDQSECRNEIGLKNNTAFMEDAAQRGQQAVAAAIDRITLEGNMMAAIENRSNAIAEIAASNSLQIYDRNINFLPKSKPQIDFVGGNIDISVDYGYVEIKSKSNMPIIDVEIGNVETYLRQKPELKIEYIGKELDKSI